jgi:DNA-directed RNA polymerase subunit K/omega
MDRITKFEKTRILGLRASQIANGAKPLVDISGLRDPLKIAEKEYYSGKIPISIIRTLPNGKKIRIDIVPSD